MIFVGCGLRGLWVGWLVGWLVGVLVGDEGTPVKWKWFLMFLIFL
jgi:hypothetical protein